jgi:PIN domain nuclease of toxin-antitoxin system
VFDDEKLSVPVRQIVKDLENVLFVSTISYWEIALKYSIGKLDLEGVTPADLPQHAKSIEIATLSVSDEEASTFYKLPRLSHKDPFDRLIVWQAISHNLTLISKDRHMQDY